MNRFNKEELKRWLKRSFKKKISINDKTIIAFLMAGFMGMSSVSFGWEYISSNSAGSTGKLYAGWGGTKLADYNFANKSVGLGDEISISSEGRAVAIGQKAKVKGSQGVAVGSNSTAWNQATAIGNDVYAIGNSSIAIGNDDIKTKYTDNLNKNTVYKLFADDPNNLNGTYLGGVKNKNEFKSLYVENPNRPDVLNYSPTYARGQGAIAIGSRTAAYGDGATGIGTLSFALADRSTAVGLRTYVDFDAAGATAIGEQTSVFADNTLAIGNKAQATSVGSLSIGQQAIAAGEGSVSIGQNVLTNAMLTNEERGKFINRLNKYALKIHNIEEIISNTSSITVGNNTLTDANNNPLIIAGNPDSQGNPEKKVEKMINEIIAGKEMEGALDFKKVEKSNKPDNNKPYLTFKGENGESIEVKKAVNKGKLSTSIGYYVYNNGSNSFAGGTATAVEGDNSVGIGSLAYVSKEAPNAVAIGVGAAVLSENSVSIGTGSTVYGAGSVSLGIGNRVGGNDSDGVKATNLIALGYGVTVQKSSSIGIGSGSTVSNIRGIAIGNDSRVTMDNSIALGYKSITDYGEENLRHPGWVANGSYSIPASSQVGVISVGQKGLERRITNLASGYLDSDAVTVSQLKTLQDRLDTEIGSEGQSISFISINKSSGSEAASVLAVAQKQSNYDKYIDLKQKQIKIEARFKAGENIDQSSITPLYRKVQELESLAYISGNETLNKLRKVYTDIKDGVYGEGNNFKNEDMSNAVTEAVGHARFTKTDDENNLLTTTNYKNDGATGKDAIAIGYKAKSEGNSSIAIGKQAQVGGKYYKNSSLPAGTDKGQLDHSDNILIPENVQSSIAIGAGVNALNQQSTAIGNDTDVIGEGAIAIGSDDANGYNNKVTNKTVYDNYYKIEGDSEFKNSNGYVRTRAKGNGSVAIGAHAVASNNGSLALGVSSISGGAEAVAIGVNSLASGQESFAGAKEARAAGGQSIAIGHYASTGKGDTSHVTGGTDNESGQFSVAIGSHVAVTGQKSVYIGKRGENGRNYQSSAIASDEAVGLGYDNQIGSVSNGAVAIGRHITIADSNSDAIVIGTHNNEKTAGKNGVAIGLNTNAGESAVAIGESAEAVAGTVAIGKASVAKNGVSAYKQKDGTYINPGFNQSVNNFYSFENNDAKDISKAKVWVPTGGEFSVGNEDENITRRITNVAAGRNDTDAVNVAQLKKVTGNAILKFKGDENTESLNLKNDTLSVVGAGAGYTTTGESAITKKRITTIAKNNTIEISFDETGLAKSSELNDLSKKVESNTTNITKNAENITNNTTNITNNAGNIHKNTTDITNLIDKVNAQKIKYFSVKATDPLESEKDKKNSDNEGAEAAGSIAVGKGAKVAIKKKEKVSSPTEGNAVDATNTTEQEVAVSSDDSIAIGTDSFVAGKDSIALGHSSKVTSKNAIALGLNSISEEENSIAIGNGAKSKVNGGVAIGSGSISQRTEKSTGYDPLTNKVSTETGLAWKATSGDFAIGSDSITRQITGVAAGSQDTDAVNVAQLKSLAKAVGDTSKDGTDGRNGENGPAGKDALNGVNVNDKVNALRRGEAGPVVYTNEAGERLVIGKDGKYYKPSELKDKVYVSTAGKEGYYVKNEQTMEDTDGDGIYTVKNGANLTGKLAEQTPVRLSLVADNGETTTPEVLGNIGSSIVDMPVTDNTNTIASKYNSANDKESAITSAKEALTGKTGIPDKKGLLQLKDGANGTEDTQKLNSAATVRDLQAVAISGLDFAGNDGDTKKVHRVLGETLKITGEGTVAGTTTAKDNIKVEANSAKDGLEIKLASNLKNIDSLEKKTNTNTTKISLGDGEVTFSKTTPAAGEAKTNSEVKIKGVAAGDIKANSADAINGKQIYDIEKNVLGYPEKTGNSGELEKPTFTAVNGSGKTAAPTTFKGAIDDLTIATNKGLKVGADIDKTSSNTAVENNPVTNQLGSTIKVVRASSTITVPAAAITPATLVGTYAGDNLVTKVSQTDGNTNIEVGFKEVPRFKGLELNNGENNAPTIKLTPDAKGTLTLSKDPKDTTGEEENKDKVVLRGLKDDKAKDSAVTRGALDALKDTLGLNGNDGAAGADGSKGPAGKDGLDGKSILDKVQALREGSAGPVVYTNEAGERLVIGKDGKYYKPSELKDKVYVSTAGKEGYYVKNEQTMEDTDGDGIYTVKNGANLTGKLAEQTPVRLSLVADNGETTTPEVLGNIGSSIVDMPVTDNTNTIASKYNNTAATGNEKSPKEQAIELAQKALNGDTNPNKKGLLQLTDTEDTQKLNSAATVRDLQAVAIAGLDFEGNTYKNSTGVHKTLGQTLIIKGEGTDLEKTIEDSFTSAAGNIRVDSNGTYLNIRLSDKLKDITSLSTKTVDGKKVKLTASDISLRDVNKETTQTADGIRITENKVEKVGNKNYNYTVSAKYTLDGAVIDNYENKSSLTGDSLVIENSNSGDTGNKNKATLNREGLALTDNFGKDNLLISGANETTTSQILLKSSNDENKETTDSILIKAAGKYNEEEQGAKIVLNNGTKLDGTPNESITIKSGTLSETPSIEFHHNNGKVIGLEARNILSEKYGVGENETRAATESAVKHLSDQIGTPNSDGRDGKDGTNGSAGSTGPTGKDGLNGKDLTSKVNAIRNGEAGIVVYTDQEGNRLVKANNGKYYKADEVDAKGDPLEGKAAVENIKATLVNPDGTTENPVVELGNIKSSLGTDIDPKNLKSDIDSVKNSVETKSKGVINTLYEKINKKDLNKVVTVGDLQAVAVAGLDFAGNVNGPTHRKLGETLSIIGENGVSSFNDYSTANVATKVSEGKIEIGIKKTPEFEGLKLKENKGTTTVNLTPSNGVLTLSNGNSTNPVQLKGIADGTKANDAVNFSQLEALKGTVSGQKIKYFSVNATDPEASESDKKNSDNKGAQAEGSIAVGKGARVINKKKETAGVVDETGSVLTPETKVVAQTDSKDSIAIGTDSEVFGANAIAIGKNSQVSKAKAIAIGYSAVSEVEGGIALGDESVSNRLIENSIGYDPLTNEASKETKVAWKATKGALSIGNDGTQTRQIIGVAAGSQDTDAVNVAQLKKLANAVGNTSKDGKDGRNGTNGIAGKDALNGVNVNDKVNALRRGEAGPVVYTDKDGNRVVKGRDGNYYKLEDIKNKIYVEQGETKGYYEPNTAVFEDKDNDGVYSVKQGQQLTGAAATSLTTEETGKIRLSLVADNGETTTPEVLGNIGSSIVDMPVTDNTNTIASKYNNTAATGNEKSPKEQAIELAQKALNGDTNPNKKGLLQLTDTEDTQKLNSASTLRDLQALSIAGLDFEGNTYKNSTGVHKTLGQTLIIKGEGTDLEKTIEDSFTSAAGNIRVDSNGTYLNIRLSDKLKDITSLSTKTVDGKKVKLTASDISLRDVNKETTQTADGIRITENKVEKVGNKNYNYTVSAKYTLDGAVIDNYENKSSLTGDSLVIENSNSGDTGNKNKATLNREGLALTDNFGKDNLLISGANETTTSQILLKSSNDENKETTDSILIKAAGKYNEEEQGAKIVLNNGTKLDGTPNESITIKSGTLSETPSIEFHHNNGKVIGLEARNILSEKYGVGENETRAATESAVKHLSDQIGTPNSDGRDGKDGTNGSAGSTGPTGKDGLNGKDLTSKVNAIRNGEAGIVVYTDQEGNRLVKANNGKYYKADEVDAKGDPLEGKAAVENIKATLVNPDGTTENPVVELGNIKSSLGTDIDPKNLKSDIDSVKNSVETKSKGVINTLYEKINKKDLNKVVTVGDLQAVAVAGLDFAGNVNGPTHRKLGETLSIIGENGVSSFNDYSTSNVATKVSKGKIEIGIKKTPEFEGLKLKENGGSTTINLTPNNGTLTLSKTPKVGEDDKVVLEGLKPGTTPDSAVTKGQLDELAKNSGDSSKDGEDGRNGEKGAAGKDGLNGVNVNDKVNALRRGEAGPVVYTDNSGNRVVKANDGNFYTPEKVTKTGEVIVTVGNEKYAKVGNEYYKVNDDRTLGEKVEKSNVEIGYNKAQKPTIVTDVRLSLVAQDGETTNPEVLGNVGSALGTDKFISKNLSSGIGSKISVGETKAKKVAEELNKLNEDKILDSAATIRDLQALSAAGLDFAGNVNGPTHRKLGKTLTIIGKEGVNSFDDYTTANVATQVTEGKIEIGIKQKPEFKEITVKDIAKDGKTLTLSPDKVELEKVEKNDAGQIISKTTISTEVDGTTITKANVDANGTVTPIETAEYKLGGTTLKDKDGNKATLTAKDLTFGDPNATGKNSDKKSTKIDKSGITVNGTDGTSKISITAGTDGNSPTIDFAKNGINGTGIITGLKDLDANADGSSAVNKNYVDNIAKKLGDTSNDKTDGRNGENGQDGKKGAAGKDGLNGVNVNDKVNALRRGEAGPVVYTDNSGNRVVKANDGNFYTPEKVTKTGEVIVTVGNEKYAKVGNEYYKVNDDRTLGEKVEKSNVEIGYNKAQKPTIVTDVRLSLVAQDGETTNPEVLGNVGSSIVTTPVKQTDGTFNNDSTIASKYNKKTGEGENQTDDLASREAITAAQGAITGEKGILKLTDAKDEDKQKLNSVATVRDLQALSIAGLDFEGNSGEVHRVLGSKLTIKGEGTVAENTAANNIKVEANKAKEGLEIKLASNLKNITSLENAKVTKDAQGSITKTETTKISIGDGEVTFGKTSTPLTGDVTNSNVKLKGIADGVDANDAVNKGQLDKLADKLGDSSKDGEDGRNGTDGITGKDGLNGVNVNDKVNALRRGESGPVVYTDAKGNRVVKANDGKFYDKSVVTKDGDLIVEKDNVKYVIKVGDTKDTKVYKYNVDTNTTGEENKETGIPTKNVLIEKSNEQNNLSKAKEAKDIRLSLVDQDGETTKPEVLGNVADGTISNDSKDAINGSQIKKLGDALGLTVTNNEFSKPIFEELIKSNGQQSKGPENLLNAVNENRAKLNEGFNIRATEGDTTSTQYLGSTTVFKEADGELIKSTDNDASIKYVGNNLVTSYKYENGTGQVEIGLKENPEFKEVTVQDGSKSVTISPNNISLGDGTTKTIEITNDKAAPKIEFAKDLINDKPLGVITGLKDIDEGSNDGTQAVNKNYVDKKVNNISNVVDGAKKELAGGIAGAYAAAGIPQVTYDKLFGIGAGFGYYKGESAIAVGISGQNRGRNVVYKASVSLGTKSEVGVSAGVNISLGAIKDEKQVSKDLINRLNKLESENSELRQMVSQNRRLRYVIDNFVLDSANITKAQIAKLKEIVEVINKEFKDKTIVIIGYTDISYKEGYNMDLGMKRAKAARNALIKLGISDDVNIVLKSGGYNEMVEGNYSNQRRVEILINEYDNMNK
ncbi:OmpA family protein [Oceanivirga miroungae]|uniref:Surface protein/Bartonella adhesin BadA n=1 Tax=Oceanivirga miroungae TaxID=1130046 RepID=A0A6I8MCC1_9FUSO|nr:OmpA family protein [Oceanivirga miroungae]VWL85892.1 Surface protein/Bartonella adhesin BadA [Oceanivirga miroungae]